MKNLNIYTFRELIKMYIDERPMPDVAFVTQTEAMKLQSMGKEMNNNSEWITDRTPYTMDEHTVFNQFGEIVSCMTIKQGEPWMPIKRPEPYVKPNRWDVVDSQKIGFAVYDGTKVMKVVAINLPTREAAERIAAIYEEVMP